MSTPSVKGKSAASKHQPNLLEQMGGRLHEMLVGKKPAPKPAAKKAAPTVAAAKPAPKPTTAPTPTPTPTPTPAKAQRASSPPARNVSAKHEEAAKNGVAGRGSAAKKPEICWAPLTMKSADGSSRYCISKNTKGAGYTALDPKGDTVTLHIKQLKDSHAALKPTSDKHTHAGRVRREGTALQKQEWSKASQGMPTKTEFKQGRADALAGMADSSRRSVNTLVHVGQKMAHSRLIGVAQLGEGIGLATDAIKGLNSAVQGAPKFFQDSGDLLSGRTKTSKRDVAAGVVSGAGKLAYGMGSGLVDIGARIVAPGDWRDNVSKGIGTGQQMLDGGYRGAVKNAGVNPESKSYNVASTTTQIVGTVGSFFLPAKAAKGGAMPKATNAGTKGVKGNKAVPGSSAKPAQHPVEGLKNAVQQHKEGKISDKALRDAMSHATDSFATSKASKTGWDAKTKVEFTAHMADAQHLTGGATRTPAPGTAPQTSATTSTKTTSTSTTKTTTNGKSSGAETSNTTTGDRTTAGTAVTLQNPGTPAFTVATALHNVVQRVSRGGTSNVRLHQTTAQPLAAQTQTRSPTLKGQTSTGQTVKLKPVGTSPVGSASIKPLAQNIRAAFAVSKAAKTPNESVQVGKTSIEDIETQIQKNISQPKFQAVLDRSNSPAEIQLQNKAIDAMRDQGVVAGSYKRPDQPLDISKWNLPMGEVIFGKQALPGPVLPGLEVNFAKKGGALVSQQVTDARTGQIIHIDPRGKLSVNNTQAPKKVTAQTPVRPVVALPAVKALESAGFNRGGPRFTLKFLDHQGTVDVWYQTLKTPSDKTRPIPNAVKPNVNKVIRQIMTDVVRNANRIRNTEDFGEFVAKKLNEKLPKSVGWALKITPPPASVGAGNVGANLGSYIEIGNLQAAISSGAVLYNPNARVGSRYSLNTRVNAEGNTVMAKPLEIIVGKRLGISPLSIPNIPTIPMPWGTSVGVSFVQAKETKVPLAGEVNPSLLRSIDRGLNSAMSMQIWHDAGADGYRQVRQVNFSVPLALAREGSYELPRGWPNIHDRLVPESQQNNDAKWSSYTSAIANWGSPEFFGISVKGGIRYERVEPVRSAPFDLSRIRHSSSLARQTPVSPLPTERLSVEPFIFMSHEESSPLIEVISSDVINFRDAGARVLPEVKGILLGGRQANVPMAGSVLNALNNYPVTSSDIGPIIQFVQNLRPKGAVRKETDAHVYALVKDHAMGQPLSAEKQADLRAFIYWYTTYETPPRFGSFRSVQR